MDLAFGSIARSLASAFLAVAIGLGVPANAQPAGDPAAAETAAAAPGEAAFEQRLREAYDLMQGGSFDKGYAQLRATLSDLANTDLFSLTVLKYTEAGRIFHQNRFDEEAETIFAEGEQARAMQQDVSERADFYLAYAEFKVAARDFARIVPLYSTAANLYAQYHGTESREVMNCNDRLAVALDGTGQLGTAANLLQGNYDLALKKLGPDDELTWRFADNLAETLRGIGAPSRALQYDLELLARRTERYGRDHFNVLVTANNTARDYLDLGDYADAVKSFELNRQIAVALRAQDPGWEVQAESWLLYTLMLSGEQPFDDANIAEMDALVTNSAYPAILRYKAAHLLAAHFAAKGDTARSMKHLEQALGIASGEMSLNHPLTFETRRAIANANASDDPGAAAEEYRKLDKDMLAWLAMQVMFAGSRDFAEATRALADEMLYDYALLAGRHPAMVSAFADATRRWPSLDDGRRETVRKLMRLVDPHDEIMLGMLRRQLRLSLMNQELFTAGTAENLAWEVLEESRQLDDKINARLVEQNFDPATLDKPLPIAREILGPDQALISYFITRKWKPDRRSAEPFEDTRLYAIVWRKDKEPRLHDLGDPRAITPDEPTARVASLRSTRSGERAAISIAGMGKVFAGLDDHLIAPLLADLAGAETLFIIPDGQLFAVPFSLLRDEQGRLLEQRFTVRLLTRPESLYGISADQTLPESGRAILVGGLDYANGPEKGADPLPGTLREVEAIAGLLGNDNFSIGMLTGAAASEPALRKEMENAAVAHLATHGSYRSARNGGASNVDTLWQSDVILSKSGDRRLMTRDETDGRLYAFEIMSWDLSGLDLLVLSACETGRGEETFVGGLRGLPTAINIAGARRSLLTLWPVNDAGTAIFMERYYRHLVEGMTYAAALRQTRRDAIDGKLEGAQSSQVWAAFVMFEN